MTKRLISFILSFCILIGGVNCFSVVCADEGAADTDYQRQVLQNKLDEINKKLNSLGSQSKETEEYIQALDEKISYLNEQFLLAKQEAKSVETRVSNLEKNISKNEKELESIKGEVALLERNMIVLNDEFSATYQSYCERIRAIYVSSVEASTLSFLIESDGVQNLMTRLEMIRSISKRDGKLLSEVKEQTEEIVETKEKLDEKKKTLSESQVTLKKNKESLKTEKVELLKKQEDMASQQAVIEEQQFEANKLLKRLNDKTKQYGEFRDITQAELDEIDAAIAEADKKYADPEPETTTTTTTTKKKTTTTTTTTTTKKHSPEPPETTDKPTTTTTTTTTTTAPTTAPENTISLTYPCPSYKKITCGFGAYKGHTGCDFSTNGNENQKIVAAESGTVILVKLLNYSYGHYVVIRHDKKTLSGKTVYTLYAHNNDIIVSAGDYVKKGKQIAYSGTTGNSTGPHCHFEVRVGGSSQSYAVDPAGYLP